MRTAALAVVAFVSIPSAAQATPDASRTTTRLERAACNVGTGRLVHGGVDPRACTARDFAHDVRAATAEQLTAALAAASCGGRVVIAPGTYAGDFTLAHACTPARPILVQAESGATVTGGTFTLKGDGLVLAGVTILKGGLRVEGNENRITRNALHDSPKTAIQVTGARNLVDRNETDGTDGAGIEIQLGKDGSVNRDNRVERNWVHRQVGQGNGHEGIRVLTDSFHKSGTRILYNLLEAIDVPGEGEAISIKSSGLTIRGNTLLDSPQSHFTNRHGAENLYEANWLENTGGMNVWGDRHVVRGNVLRKSPINVPQGDGTQDSEGCPETPRTRPTTAGCVGVHPAARHVTITDNEATEVIIGDEGRKVTWKTDFLPESTPVVRSGHVRLGRQRGAHVEEGAPRGVHARKLTRRDVGPGAPESPAP